MNDPRELFLHRFEDAVVSDTLDKLVLSRPKGGGQSPRQLRVRRILLRNEPHLSLVWRHENRDTTENLRPGEGVARVAATLNHPFRSANLYTREATTSLDFSKRGRPMLKTTGPASDLASGTGHDREKNRCIPLDSPWLRPMGVVDDTGTVLPSMSRKWKQINRFAEILDGVLARCDPGKTSQPFRVVDFGCGRGLLTFAAHERLFAWCGKRARVGGVELREHLAVEAERVARECALEGLGFVRGDIRDHGEEPLNGMIALHACDTTTDLAILAGVRAGAAFLLFVPCCQKEIRPQIQVPESLEPVLRHGAHLGQMADMLTDSLRVLALEACGYDTTLMEFVSLEHTAKNKMILAVRGSGKPGAAETFHKLKSTFGIQTHSVEAVFKLQQTHDHTPG